MVVLKWELIIVREFVFLYVKIELVWIIISLICNIKFFLIFDYCVFVFFNGYFILVWNYNISKSLMNKNFYFYFKLLKYCEM